MDNRERLMTAIRLGQPDRVPFFDFFDEASVLKTAEALWGKDIFSETASHTYVEHKLTDEAYKYHEMQLKIIRELDIDAVLAWSLSGYEIIPGEKNLLKDRYGVVYRESKHGQPFPVKGPVRDEADLKKIALMEPNLDDFKIMDYFKENAPERVLVYSLIDTFRMSWSLLGAMEKLLPLFVLKPDFCQKIARVSTDLLKREIEMAIEKGAEVILQDGDLAFKKNSFMSQDHFKKFVQPYYLEMTDLAHKHGVPILKHSDGNIWPIIDDIIDAGYDGIHPVEPQSMDIVEVKERLKGKACVLGNIDCTHLLPYGTEEDVISSVKETIQKVAPGGGYILSSSNSIHPGCKGENTVAMFKAARENGTYPINIDL